MTALLGFIFLIAWLLGMVRLFELLSRFFPWLSGWLRGRSARALRRRERSEPAQSRADQ